MKTVSKVWGNTYLKLNQIDPKCPLENFVVKKTMRPQQYKERAELIISKLNIENSILEIGCGYGGLAQEILKRISVSYTAVDNEIMLNQTRKFLGDKVEYIEATKIETLQNRKFELFISHYCLSETPVEYREYILKNIIMNCQKVSVMDYDDKMKPTAQMLEDGYDMLPSIIEYYLNKYFIIEKKECPHHRGEYLFTGERKK